MDFYTRHIKSNPDWEFVEVFADRGITGTNTKNRENFNRMIDLALNGGIDIILTKSISRFRPEYSRYTSNRPGAQGGRCRGAVRERELTYL